MHLGIGIAPTQLRAECVTRVTQHTGNHNGCSRTATSRSQQVRTHSALSWAICLIRPIFSPQVWRYIFCSLTLLALGPMRAVVLVSPGTVWVLQPCRQSPEQEGSGSTGQRPCQCSPPTRVVHHCLARRWTCKEFHMKILKNAMKMYRRPKYDLRGLLILL
jgi:hypothetical protein